MGETNNTMEITRTAKTCVSKSECQGVYTIKNFRDFNITDKFEEKRSESPLFYNGQFNMYTWNVDIVVNSYDEKYSKYVGIRLYLMNDHEVEVDKLVGLRFVASLIDEDGNKYLTKSEIFPNMDSNALSIEDFVLREDVLNNPKLLTNGELKIAFEMWFEEDINENEEIRPSQKNHLKILGNVFDAGKYTDFKFIVKEKEFNVHRAILAAHSPIFEAMFDTEMQESNVGKVEIVDVEEKVLEKLLRFIYVGKVEDFEDLGDKILIAAEKYQVKELKQVCEDFLIEQLSFTNVYDTLRLAGVHNAETLQKKSIEFFHRKAKELRKEENFKAHLKTLSENLKTDLIDFLVNKL